MPLHAFCLHFWEVGRGRDRTVRAVKGEGRGEKTAAASPIINNKTITAANQAAMAGGSGSWALALAPGRENKNRLSSTLSSKAGMAWHGIGKSALNKNGVALALRVLARGENNRRRREAGGEERHYW